MTGAAPRAGPWRLVTGTDLRWRRFDDDWVVYDRGSGNTTQLAPWPAAVLGLLEAGPRHAADLLAELRAELVTEPAATADSGLAGALDAVLQQLEGLGLVQTSAG